MSLCLGLTKIGAPCTRKADKKTGYCQDHSPKKAQAEKEAAAKEEARKQEEARQEIAKREQERQEVQERATSLYDKILEINDLESLRSAEQYVMLGLIDESIDAKVGSALSQMLKHQAELLEKIAPKKEDLTDKQKGALIKLSVEMTTDEMWHLMQDFASGVEGLKKKAQTVDAIDVTEVKQIAMEAKSEQSQNVDSERPGRAGPEQGQAGIEDEIF